jgi:hypothetical protein
MTDDEQTLIVSYLTQFLDEVSKPKPARNLLSGRLVREFSNLLSQLRGPDFDELREDLIDIVNIIYLQPTAILYRPPEEVGNTDKAAQVSWGGTATLSPSHRFGWPLFATQRSGRKVG